MDAADNPGNLLYLKIEKEKKMVMKRKNINPNESRYIPEDKKKLFEELSKSDKKTVRTKKARRIKKDD